MSSPDVIGYEEAITLLTTMGQLKQIRAWTIKDIPSDSLYLSLSNEHGNFIILKDLEVNLYGKLAGFIQFLKDIEILESVEIEADFEEYDTMEEHTVLLTNDNELILLHTTGSDKDWIQNRLMIEWTKRMVAVKGDAI